MRSDVSVMALAAMAASASAQAATPGFNSINTPAENAVLHAGTSQPIAWKLGTEAHGDENVCVQLICGESPDTLVPEKTFGNITCGIPNKQEGCDWSIPAKLPQYEMCGIKIYLEQTPTIMQYSGHFTIQAKDGPSTEGEQGSATSGGQPQVPGASGSQTGPVASGASPVTSSAPAITSASVFNSTAPIPTAVRNCAACGADGGSTDGLTLSSTTLSTSGPATLATQTRVSGVANPTAGLNGSGPSTSARPSTPVTAGASAVGAGILSVLGGLTVAVLAL